MAWPDETKHQFWPVPELAKTGFEPHRRHNVAGLILVVHIIATTAAAVLCWYSLGVSDTVSGHIAIAKDSKLR